MTSRHTYRELLQVNFSEQYELLSIAEEFITVQKNVLGLPLTAGIDYQLFARTQVGIRAIGQFHFDTEDALWTAGVRFRREL